MSITTLSYPSLRQRQTTFAGGRPASADEGGSVVTNVTAWFLVIVFALFGFHLAGMVGHDFFKRYTKCLKQSGYCLVDLSAFGLFEKALKSGDPTQFELPGLLGGTRPLNGPAGAFALTLSGADSQCFGDDIVPPPPKVDSPKYATELVELYWASLLRDVPFSQYETNATAIAAAKELTALKAHYTGPLDGGEVTPKLLFRGGFKNKPKYFSGENVGPYISQLCIQPTALGALKIDQKMVSYAPGVDYTDYSILLGEAVALKFLRDQAWTYAETFDVTITKIDGTKYTISNH